MIIGKKTLGDFAIPVYDRDGALKVCADALRENPKGGYALHKLQTDDGNYGFVVAVFPMEEK